MYPTVLNNNTLYNTVNTSASQIRVISTGVDCGTATVTNNIIYTKSESQYGMLIGSDSSGAGDGLLNGAVITGNRLYGPAYYDTTKNAVTTHGLEFGYNINAIIRNNYVDGFGYGFVIKGNQTWTANDISYNVIKNCIANSAIYLKGQKNVPVYNNTLYNNPSLTMGVGFQSLLQIAINADSADVAATGATVKNNILSGKAGSLLIKVMPTQKPTLLQTIIFIIQMVPLSFLGVVRQVILLIGKRRQG